MTYKKVKGMRDFVGNDMRKLRYVSDCFRKVIMSYGYDEVKTPVIEYMDTLEARSGKSISEQIYTFEDKSGERVGLRFDITVPATRVMAEKGKGMPKPVKMFYVDRAWRYERPQKGRYREFFHAGIENFGSSHPSTDAEAISCFSDCFNEVGIKDCTVLLNHRKIMQGLSKKMGIEGDNVYDVIRVLDKRGKIGKETMIKELEGIGISPDNIDLLMGMADIRGLPGEAIEEYKKRIPRTDDADAGLSNMESIMSYLKSYGASGNILIDFGLARGFDYYTDAIFEMVPENPEFGSLGGGGRYDNLVDIYGGGNVPATGFALGVDRTAMYLDSEGMLDDLAVSGKAFIVPVGENVIGESIRIAQDLRKAGVAVDMDATGSSVRKQLNYISKVGGSYAVIVGERELQDGVLSLKDMRNGNQWDVKRNDIFQFLSDKIG